MRAAAFTLLVIASCLHDSPAPAQTNGIAPAAPASSLAVSGIVQDQTGGILPHADVQLVSDAGIVVQATSTDDAGLFRFATVGPGQYEVRAAFPGFKPGSVRVRVGPRAPSAQKIVLGLADFKQGVTVDNGGGALDTSTSNNLSAVSVDRQMLEGLPILDQDYVATLSRFLDAGSLGTGGPTIVVNGMEVSAPRVSPSAVQQIRINQDPYATEYGRAGRGRIEILTKPGSQHFTGELNTVVRDAHFDARNAFASGPASDRKRILEGLLSGPVGHSGRTSFLMSGNYQTDDQQAFVFAIGPSGPIRDVVPQPNTQALLSLSFTHQVGNRTVIAITPTYEYEASDNRGVGGVTLASAGTDFRHHEQQVRYTQQTSLGTKAANQFQILVGHEREPTTSVSETRGIVVADAFTGGGGQGDLVRTELHMQLNENLTWSIGRHTLQAGFQLPDWSRRGFFDRTNFGGIYYFSSLDAYVAGHPYAFTQQRGNGTLALLEKQIGAYIKDDWQARPNLSFSIGLRYDWQNYFHDDDNFGPRLSVAWAPRGSRKNVIRGGVGVFTDRSGPVIIAELLHSRIGDLTRYVISQPAYPDPLISDGAAPPRSLTQLAPGVQIPRTVQFGINLDRQLRKNLTVSVGYTGARGYHLFRSRDANAPVPPLYLQRPDPEYGAIREIESNSRQLTHSMQVTLRGQVMRWFNGQTQYTLSRASNDTNGLGYYAANDYDSSGEWARADFDRRHRLVVLGQVTPGRVADVGVGLTMNSAGPYTALLGADIYNNARGRARPPGVGRNTLTGAGFAQLDLRLSHTVKMGRRKEAPSVSFAVDAFNVLNRVNYGGFVGTVGSPLFGHPTSARPPRQFQLSARYEF